MKYLVCRTDRFFRGLAGVQPARSHVRDASRHAAEAKAAKNEVVIPPDQQAAAMIETQAAALSSEPDLLRVKGHIAIDDNRTWRLGVRTQGSVTKVYAGLGDHVTKGQILARYHADEVRDSRAMYRAAVSERDRAIAATAQAQRNLDRAKRLLELKAGSVQQVEQAQQDLATAQAAVRKAEIEVDRTRDLLEDDLKVPADPSANRADETEDEVPILAPADGFILEKNVTPGRTVEPDSVTFVIGDLSRVWMLASVRQEDLGEAAESGRRAYVTVAARPSPAGKDRESRAAVRSGHARDAGAHRARQSKQRSSAGDAGRRGDSGGQSQALRCWLPSDAVQQVNGQDVVFVRTAPDRFAVRPVSVGETSGGKTPILEGIKAGDSDRRARQLHSQIATSEGESGSE